MYMLDFFCSGIQFYVLLSPYLSFISFLYIDLYVLGDDAWIRKARVLTTPRGLADVSVSEKNMFDRYYCIKSFSLEKFGKKPLRKVHFCITLMAHKSMKNS